jgi:hypothetical protein
MDLTAIDPGLRTGIAWFVNGLLVRAGLFEDNAVISCLPLVVVECPEYQKARRVNPNDLITLALRVGRWQARVERSGGKCELVRPSEWKGLVPKRIHTARTLAKLSREERLLVDGARHDVIDAVGIGLWRLGR